MNKPRIIFDFNLGTLLPLLALALAGWDRYAALEAKVQVIDQRGLARMQISDTFQAETKKALADVASAPKDIVELKKGQEVANARMDRLADLMIRVKTRCGRRCRPALIFCARICRRSRQRSKSSGQRSI